MTTTNRIALSSDHAAIPLRQAIAAHVAAHLDEGRHAADYRPEGSAVPLSSFLALATL